MFGANRLRRIRSKVVRSKILMQRTMSYIAILNSAMIMFLVLSRLQDYGLEIYITRWFVPIYIVTIMVLLIFGWLEDKIGFYSEELSQVGGKNPNITEIKKSLIRLDGKIDNLEKKLVGEKR